VGGRALVRKTKISDEFGYFALFLDNVGNRLGLWSRT
jgi:predicted enzyme related to lactoylglutathione lyase